MLLNLMNPGALGRPPMVGADRWLSGSQSLLLSTAVLPRAWAGPCWCITHPGPHRFCVSLSFRSPPTFPARWECQGSPGEKLRVFPFLLNFLGPSGPALNMEGREAQHASLAAHSLGYAMPSSGS